MNSVDQSLGGRTSTGSAHAEVPSGNAALKSSAARAAGWSVVSSIVLRMGSFVVGIVLARILMPEQFGIFAVALTVQGILMTVADLGLSSDLIRSERPEEIAPTIATLGLISGGTLTALTVLTAPVLAELMGSPEAAPAIAVLCCTLLLGSVSLVPYGMLMRRFQQRAMFVVGVVDFVVSTSVTLLLVAAGFGVMGLALGRVAAQIVSTVLQFWLARVRPRYGFDRTRVRPILAFGLPIAGANLLGWALVNIDNVILVRALGATALGYYVLAFNVSSWPMNALSQAVRSISMPYFSRADSAAKGLPTVVAVGWAAALPAGGVLAALAAPVVAVLYGEKWMQAAPVLAALGVYGAFRVLFEIFNGFLYASGRARPVLWLQAVGIVALVAAMIPASAVFGIVGAGWAHVGIAAGVLLPSYLVILRRTGVVPGAMLRRLIRPSICAIMAIAAAWACGTLVDVPFIALVLGGCTAMVVYAACMWTWVRREWQGLRS